MDTTKMKWLGKLAKSKNFVVITDKEAALQIRNVSKMDDEIARATYVAELHEFRRSLDKVIKDLSTKKKPTKRKKIPVTYK